MIKTGKGKHATTAANLDTSLKSVEALRNNGNQFRIEDSIWQKELKCPTLHYISRTVTIAPAGSIGQTRKTVAGGQALLEEQSEKTSKTGFLKYPETPTLGMTTLWKSHPNEISV